MRFIDLFAGVGGFRFGLEKANKGVEGNGQADICLSGGHEAVDRAGDDIPQAERPNGRVGNGTHPKNHFECVWSCEIDRWAKAVYKHNFGETPAGDARRVDSREVPDFDLLCAGFPCQSFSLAGKRGGFEDARGTLFYEICRIARAKGPQMLLLENVGGLLSADDRLAFKVVLQSLGDLGYDVEWQVLNSKDFGVPQNRPRVFIVGHLGGFRGQEVFPIPSDGGEVAEKEPSVRALCGGAHSGGLHSQTTGIAEGGGELKQVAKLRPSNSQSVRVYSPLGISPTLSGVNRAKSTGQSHSPIIVEKKPMIYRHPMNYGKKSVYSPDETHPSLRTVSRNPKVLDDTKVGVNPKLKDEIPTLRGNSHGNLAKVLDNNTRIRRLTPRECERLQGFPDDFTRYGITEKGEKVEISDTQRYKMMGNAVTVNVVEFLARRIGRTEGTG